MIGFLLCGGRDESVSRNSARDQVLLPTEPNLDRPHRVTPAAGLNSTARSPQDPAPPFRLPPDAIGARHFRVTHDPGLVPGPSLFPACSLKSLASYGTENGYLTTLLIESRTGELGSQAA